MDFKWLALCSFVDSPYIGTSYKEIAIMTSSNNSQINPPSFCFLSRRNYYSCKSGEKSYFFDFVFLFPSIVISTVLNCCCCCGTDVI